VPKSKLKGWNPQGEDFLLPVVAPDPIYRREWQSDTRNCGKKPAAQAIFRTRRILIDGSLTPKHDTDYNLREVIVTNSIPQNQAFCVLPFFSVEWLSDTLARTINRIHYNRSVSEVFYQPN